MAAGPAGAAPIPGPVAPEIPIGGEGPAVGILHHGGALSMTGVPTAGMVPGTSPGITRKHLRRLGGRGFQGC